MHRPANFEPLPLADIASWSGENSVMVGLPLSEPEAVAVLLLF